MFKSRKHRQVSFLLCVDVNYIFEGELVSIAKGTELGLELQKSRSFLSYVFELCGKYNLDFQKHNFMVNQHLVEFDKLVLDKCQIYIYNKENKDLKPDTLLYSLKTLINEGLHRDMILKLENTSILLHKFMLKARTEKFRGMLENKMKETISNEILIKSNIKPEIYHNMLKWIYTGACCLPSDIYDACHLLELSDEYLLDELIDLCKQNVINKLNESNVVDVMTQKGLTIPQKCEKEILNECKTIFIFEFQKIYEKDPEVESKITSVKGLITQIFLHFHSNKLSRKKLKALEKNSKKKVRFNLAISENNTDLTQQNISIDLDFDRPISNASMHSENQSNSSLLLNNEESDISDQALD